MTTEKEKIYCAGPLFTQMEREEMKKLASSLENAGYSTFLPQRDGLELTRCVDALSEVGIARNEAGFLMSRAIFALDIFQVIFACHALVANLNGRVPDEGTVSEAAMAWSRGKPVIGYKADSRTAFGGQDNPLVSGLFDFRLLNNIDEIPDAVSTELHNSPRSEEYQQATRDQEVNQHASLGKTLAMALENRAPLQELVEVILNFRETMTVA